MARKLASIQKILKLTPIPNADAIETATVLGWEVVVKKGQFNVGDLVVYMEIDSLLPNKPEFEFLKSNGMKIKTIRLRGQISQGICFPLSILPKSFVIEEGKDCTEELGVIKYEPPIPAHLAGIVKGKIPSFIPKTDETRVQVLQELLNKYENTRCYVTEKIDGTSATFYVKDGVFGVCSRNLELLEDDTNTFWKIAREMDIENKLLSLHTNVAIQGELYGENIQSNPINIKGQTIRFFNLFNIDRYRYYDFIELEVILKRLNLPMVPVIDSNYVLESNINSIVEKSKIKSTLNPKIWAEGIVIRPYFEKYDSQYGRFSFKAINPEFLLETNQ